MGEMLQYENRGAMLMANIVRSESLKQGTYA